MVEIKKSKNINVYSGKLMGLSSYGSVRTDWIQPMLDYYHHLDISKLLREINLPTDIEGHLSYDLARTSQHVFERLFLNTFSRIYPKFGLPVCLTGGCALNVLNNGTIKDTIGEENVFVPPNPNDCGLSMGFFLENNPPEGVLNVEFSGMDIQNRQFELPSSVPTDVKKITDLLLAGQIIGVVIGQSECGPRALGHRSIICYPEHPNLKDKLNSEIKFREWFRPFAPVVLEEDMPIYFSGIKKSPTMSFAPKFNVGWTRRFPAVEHIDGTGRVQSVTSTNELFYEILLELKRRNKPGILLNTSFNIRGKPLINDLKDVVETFNTSRLNGLIVENQMVIKP
jgi:carbamoyltransferase